MTETTTASTDKREAKARAQAEKAYRKASRPFWKKKRFILPVGFLALIVIVTATTGGDGATSEPAAGEVDTASAAQEQQTADDPAVDEPAPDEPVGDDLASLGSPVRDGKFEFTVEGMECGVPQIGSADFGSTAQGQFCLVDLTVKNIGDQAQTLFGDNIYVYNEAGQRYSADTEAGIYLDDSNSFIEEINPGNSLSGQVVFDVPQDAELTSIELHDSAFSSGVAASLTS